MSEGINEGDDVVVDERETFDPQTCAYRAPLAIRFARGRHREFAIYAMGTEQPHPRDVRALRGLVRHNPTVIPFDRISDSALKADALVVLGDLVHECWPSGPNERTICVDYEVKSIWAHRGDKVARVRVLKKKP